MNCYIALTAFAKTKFVEAGFPPDRIVVKPNFVEDRQAQATDGISREGALFVGRLSPEKGQDVLVRAFADVADAHLLLVGDGSLKAALETGASERVHFLGWRTDPWACLGRLHR